jgi:hypothetical protein
MPFKAVPLQYNSRTSRLYNEPAPAELRIEKWAGVNEFATPSQIADNEFAAAQNVQLDEIGAPDKRFGYGKVYATSLGSGGITGAHKTLYKDKKILTWGTAMYTQSGSSQPVSIMTGLANAKSYFFAMNDKLYMSNGTDFVQYDNSTTVTVESVAYIPTTVIGRAPTGGGTAFEKVNLLQPGRKNSFIGNAAATAFQLDTTVLDATLVTAVVAGVAKLETTDFTVNRTTGVVTFTVAPPNGSGVDNVVITFYKTVAGYATKIKGCTIQPVLFGGDNDTRVFLANGNIRYHSALYDPTYWPDTNYTKIGSDQTNITAFSQQIDTQVIFKDHKDIEPSVWSSRYNIDSSGNVTFPVFPINGVAGADAKDSVQIIQNNPTFFDTVDGIWELSTSNVRDQRIVQRISDKTNRSLLAETNKQSAISFLWKYRYGICVNSNCYVYDYRQNAWFGKWTNIYASCFFTIDGELYFGSSQIGMIYKFNTSYNDDGVAIDAYIDTKHMDYNDPEHKKLISRILYGLKPSPRASVTVSFISNTNNIRTSLQPSRRDLFDYSLFDYSKVSYASSTFPQESMRKIRVKKVGYIQFRLANSNLDESMGILSFTSVYSQQNLVKDS